VSYKKVIPKKIPLSKEVNSGGVRVNKGVKGPLRKFKGGKVRLKVNHPPGPSTHAFHRVVRNP
jgi:hypothetical protein